MQIPPAASVNKKVCSAGAADPVFRVKNLNPKS
jgi:hypothetical protein